MNKSGHTLSLDYYCIGVFIYELAAGFPPSLSQKKAAIFSEVLKNDIKFPSHFSQNLKNLITKLMNKNPQKRLGSVSGIKEILNNEWFFPMSKENIARNIIKPPIKPNVYNIYIDKEIQQKFINYYDFFCNENNDSPKNPLFQRFRKFSFSAFPIEYNEKEKKKELKNKFNTEGWQLVILSETKPISQNLGDTLENNFMELKFEEI